MATGFGQGVAAVHPPLLRRSPQPRATHAPFRKDYLMGLDMYAHRVADDGRRPLPDVDADFTDDDRTTDENGKPLFRLVNAQFYYWRKHPNLHGWMHRLYEQKGGTDPAFNCNSVRLTVEDIDALEVAVRFGTLPSTSGFFFGESTPDDREDDLEFIKRARAAIAEGDAIYYSSWW